MQEITKLAPVAVFAYNRLDHLQQTYRALSECPEAKDTDLFIFSDGAKNERAAEKVQEVRDYLHSIEQDGLFRSCMITESPENKGLAKSIISGVTKVMDQYGQAIVLEDDCRVSPYFLKYMNNCLDLYQEKTEVGSVSGYTPEFEFPDSFKADAFLAMRSCSWGWATWKDRWDMVDWEMGFMKDFYSSPKLIRRLNSCGSDRFLRLYRQTKGNGSSWSVRFGAQLVLNNQYTLYPRYSYISNIGCDDSGVHSKAKDAEAMQVDLSKALENPNLENITFVPEVQKNMKKLYSGGMVSDIKRFVATAAIVVRKKISG